MKIERERVRETFREYTDAYDATDEKIKLKIDHTYRVAELCERIAKAEQMEKTEVDLAWLLGMLHDVGRFEQLRRYGTVSVEEVPDLRDGNGTETGTEEKYAEKGTGTSGDRALEKGVSGHGMFTGL